MAHSDRFRSVLYCRACVNNRATGIAAGLYVARQVKGPFSQGIAGVLKQLGKLLLHVRYICFDGNVVHSSPHAYISQLRYMCLRLQ